jgi:hypothetical protein
VLIFLLSALFYDGGCLQTTLSEIGPGLSEPLAVTELRWTCLGSVCLNFNNDMAKDGQFEYFQRFLIASEGYQE